MILKENYLNNKFYNQFKTQKHFFDFKKTKKLVKRKKRLTMLNGERICFSGHTYSYIELF